MDLFVEALFGMIFIRTLVAYVRRPTPLHRDVMVMFSAMAVLFSLAVARQLVGEPPELVRDMGSALLLGQPFLTLRVVRQIRPVPRWFHLAALIGWLASAAAVVVVPGVLPLPMVALVVTVFVATEITTAGFFAGQARASSGASRVRLMMAALATAVFAGAIMAAGAGAGDPQAAAVTGRIALALALLSAVGYLAAFAPPAWLRRAWSSRAAYTLVRRLLSAPADRGPEAIWQLYAQTVREATDADAAVVLLCRPGAPMREVARVAMPSPVDVAEAGGDHGSLLETPTTVILPADLTDATDAPGPVLGYARQVHARFVITVPLAMHDERGVLLLFSRHRSLFTDDDVQLLGDLGSQAAALAERGQLLKDRDRLTGQLSESVIALRSASEAKSDFLANMSHELRTPLNAIIGFSDLMRTEPAADGHSTVPTQWIHHINSSGHHLLGLINQVLDLAKIEAGQVELHPQPLDLPDAITEVVATLQSLFDRKQLEITVAAPPLAVSADPMRFRQILTNLLSNAIKFTPERGRIYVAVRRLGSDIALSVADTGPGVAIEDQQRVFEEFQQVGELGARAEGTGLGLALTRRLIQAHGGRIELQSTPGHGAKFTVYLPAAGHPGPTADGETARRTAATTGTLIIEDHVGTADLLSTYLQRAGHRVAVAASGEAGLAAARESAPEAILLDLQLPGMDGWQVLTELKADDRLRHIPVVIISATNNSDVGLALGAVDYFVKPISRPTLLTWLARHGLIPPADGRAINVLAIDDDPQSLEIIDATLTAEGMRVVRGHGGAEGLALARTNDFDLIICDLLMPEVDGFDVIAALHNDPDTRGIPVVVLTAHALTDADKDRLSGKVIAFMSKAQTTTGLPDLAHLISELTGLTVPARAERLS